MKKLITILAAILVVTQIKAQCPVTITASPTVICIGQTATLTASGAVTYTWSANAGGATTASVAVSPTVNTTYTVTATSGTCTATQTITMTVNPLPTVTVNSATVCAGSTATLTASGAATYSWSTGAVGSTITPSPLATTNYTVWGISAAGCVNTATTSVTVNPLPIVTVNSATVCSGLPATLTANGALSYTWSTGATGPSLTQSPSTTTNYTVTGTNAAGCVNKATATITVNASPTVTVNSTTVCAGSSATLTATGATTYTWSANAGSVTTPSVVVSPASTTVYSVTGTNPQGCTSMTTATVTVNVFTMTIAPPVGTNTYCTGVPYQFTGNANPGPISVWKWTCTPTPGVVIQFPTQNGTNITFNILGNYTLTLLATNGTGCIDSTKFGLTVAQTPTVTTLPVAPQICQGGTGSTLYASMTPANIATGATYTWTPVTALTAYGDSAIVNPTALGVYNYSVTGTASNGCVSNPAPITVTVTPPPNPTVTAVPDTICSGTSTMITVHGMPGIATYTWTAQPAAGLGTNSGYFSPATPIYAGTVDTVFKYYISMSVKGCPPYPQYTVNVTDAPTPTVDVVADTVDNCNHKGDSLYVQSNPPIGVTFNWSPNYGGLHPTSGNPVFVNPINPVTYYVTPVLNGCIGKRDSIKVRIGDSTYASIHDEYHIICAGMMDTLIALPQRTQLNGTYQYSWAPPIGIFTVTPGKDTIVVNPTSTTIYTVTVKGTCVKRKTAQVFIAVNHCVTPVPSFSVSVDTICVNHCVWFTDLTQYSTLRPLFFLWQFIGGTPIACQGCIIPRPGSDTVFYSATDSSAIPKIKVCYHINSQIHAGGTFPVIETVGTGLPGQVATVTHQITVDPGPKAVTDYVGGTPAYNPTIQMGNTITLDATHSQGGSSNISSYVWTPSTGLSCTVCPKPVANPSVTTTYSLLVTDHNGCYDTSSITIFVDLSCFEPFVPTAFSPNGDGKNDVLYVRSICLTNFIFKVYDRWGELVFQTTDVNYGWDGNFRNTPMNAGVFVYTLDGFTSTNHQVKQKGNITLVR